MSVLNHDADLAFDAFAATYFPPDAKARGIIETFRIIFRAGWDALQRDLDDRLLEEYE